MDTNKGWDRLISKGSPFELVSASCKQHEIRVFRHGPLHLDALFEAAAAAGQRTCMIEGKTTISYDTLFGIAGTLRGELERHIGALFSKPVGIVLPNGCYWVSSLIAITSLGGIAVLGSYCGDPNELVESLKAARCEFVIADCHRFEAVCTQFPGLVVCKSDETCRVPRNWECIKVQKGNSFVWPEVPQRDPEQEAVLAFTSGSSGARKGVVSSQRALLTGVMNMLLGSALLAERRIRAGPKLDMRRPRGAPTALVLAPFSHVSGYLQVLASLFIGSRTITMERWNAHAALQAIQDYRVNALVGCTPENLRELLRTDIGRYDLSSLRTIGIHGGTTHPNILRETAAVLPHVQFGTSYGMTETNGAICLAGLIDLREALSACGPPLPSVELKIMRTEQEEAQIGAQGEIWVRGAMLLSRYCPTSESDRVREVRNGWFSTGDIGRLDGDGVLHWIARASDILASGGQRISCAEVERIIRDVRGVDDVAASVLRYGDRDLFVLAVVPHGRSAGVEGEVLLRVKGMGLPSTCKVEVVIVATIPRIDSGKADRIRIAALKQTDWATREPMRARTDGLDATGM